MRRSGSDKHLFVEVLLKTKTGLDSKEFLQLSLDPKLWMGGVIVPASHTDVIPIRGGDSTAPRGQWAEVSLLLERSSREERTDKARFGLMRSKVTRARRDARARRESIAKAMRLQQRSQADGSVGRVGSG